MDEILQRHLFFIGENYGSLSHTLYHLLLSAWRALTLIPDCILEVSSEEDIPHLLKAYPQLRGVTLVGDLNILALSDNVPLSLVQDTYLPLYTRGDQERERSLQLRRVSDLSSTLGNSCSYWLARVYEFLLAIDFPEEYILFREQGEEKKIDLEIHKTSIGSITFSPLPVITMRGRALIEAMVKRVYRVRDGKGFLAFRGDMAPIQCGVVPLLSQILLAPLLEEVEMLLRRSGLRYHVDSITSSSTSSIENTAPIKHITSIGTICSITTRYQRMDEMGVPYVVTVDFETRLHKSVLLRHRDTMSQVRLPLSTLISSLKALLNREKTWEEIRSEAKTFSPR